MPPLWVKTKDGNWVRFPIEILCQRNGEYVLKSSEDTQQILKLFLKTVGRPARDFFIYDENHIYDLADWVLKDRSEQE